ncbi:MAG: hypothetical protein U0791_21250 [Gemmataceae bacterium]
MPGFSTARPSEIEPVNSHATMSGMKNAFTATARIAVASFGVGRRERRFASARQNSRHFTA